MITIDAFFFGWLLFVMFFCGCLTSAAFIGHIWRDEMEQWKADKRNKHREEV